MVDYGITQGGTVAGSLTVSGDLAVQGNNSVSGIMDVNGYMIPDSAMGPQDHGLVGWTLDPARTASSVIAINGTVYVMKIPIRRSTAASGIWWVIGTAGALPVAGQNWVGLYSEQGTRMAASNVDASISSAGTYNTLMTEQDLVGGTFVWVAVLFNAVTPPTMLRGSSFQTSPSMNLGPAGLRAGVAATLATTLPASFTPSALTTNNCLTFFAGLSV